MKELIDVIEETNSRLDGVRTLIDQCGEFIITLGMNQHDPAALHYLASERRSAYESIALTASDYIRLIQQTLDTAIHAAMKATRE